METKQFLIAKFINREEEQTKLSPEYIECLTLFLNQFTELFLNEELLSNFSTITIPYIDSDNELLIYSLDKDIKYKIFLNKKEVNGRYYLCIDDGVNRRADFGINHFVNGDGLYEDGTIENMISLLDIFRITSVIHKYSYILDTIMSDGDSNISNLKLNQKVKEFINELCDYYIEIIKDIKYFTPKGKKEYVKIYFKDDYTENSKFEIVINL